MDGGDSHTTLSDSPANEVCILDVQMLRCELYLNKATVMKRGDTLLLAPTLPVPERE